MCHASYSNRNFFLFLIRLDEELAAQARAAGCPCGGTLHCANYPRKPRGCPRWVRAAYETRLSFCCSRCRRRTTSQSVRFLGRRVYLGWVVVLSIPLRTLARWHQWWREDFMHTPLWQAMCARFMPPVSTDGLPGSVLARFAGEGSTPMLHLLLFLSPITVRPAALGEAC